MSKLNKINQDTVKRAAAAHREAIQKHLQRRMEVARQQGDENLLRMLEAEANYFS
ncbi:hypothetical protein LKK83_19810 [Phormidium sp. CCY1219]|nr:hypothetical protein [Phormidium sp. CCY1219]MEB3829718.1 hypothetical protein [Phormidium sp. CCY1219]